MPADDLVGERFGLRVVFPIPIGPVYLVEVVDEGVEAGDGFLDDAVDVLARGARVQRVEPRLALGELAERAVFVQSGHNLFHIGGVFFREQVPDDEQRLAIPGVRGQGDALVIEKDFGGSRCRPAGRRRSASPRLSRRARLRCAQAGIPAMRGA